MTTSIAVLADRYQETLDGVKSAEQVLKDAKAASLEAREELVNAMLEEETDSIGRNGRKYTLMARAKYSKRAGMEQELFSLLRETGLGDIITETVNAGTLSSVMKQLAEENGGELPEEYADYIHVYEFTDVSVRKG